MQSNSQETTVNQLVMVAFSVLTIYKVNHIKGGYHGQENKATGADQEGKKKPGRKPMTDAEKKAAAKARAEEKAKAANLKTEVIVQFQDVEVDVTALIEEAKADFHKTKKRTLVTDMKLYVKPEERAAYYVINGEHTGSVSY